MKLAIAVTALALFFGGSQYGEAADQPLGFEVASVKSAPVRKEGEPQGMMGCFGGPGSRDPIRYTCSNASVSLMVIQAYGVKPYELRPPVSTDTYRFNVEAKVPPGATAAQVKVMLQNLLAERFNLAFHYQKSETQGYSLVVAKSGLKMKESRSPAPEEVDAPPPPGPIKDPDGFSYIPRRYAMVVGRANGLQRWVGNSIPVDRLAGLLNSLTGRPITDSTGLKGNYDFTLTFSSETVGEVAAPSVVPEGGIVPSENGGLTVFAALEKQLGLKLEPQKIVLDLFVIDHAEKIPVEN